MRAAMLRGAGGLAVVALLVAMASCSDDDGQTLGPAAGTGASGGTTGVGAGGGDGGGLVTDCNPACQPPQFCSHAKICLDAGQCAHDLDCDPGLECDLDLSECVPGGGCGGEEVSVEPVAPNMLIVLDRSCSMTKNVGGTPKWTIAVQAIEKLTNDFTDQIRFGLILFPDKVTPKCQQDAIPIPVGPGNEGAIQTMLNEALAKSDLNYPDGPCITNIDTAMEQAATEPALDDQERPSFTLLITDGKQYGCNAAGGDNGTTQIIDDLYQLRDVGTFVVGFGGGVDPAQLNIFAEAGGMTTGDPNTSYYQAEDQPSLDAALDAIANATIGCVLELASVPENAEEIYVFFDDEPTAIPRDPNHGDGWDYDPNTNQITFYGPTCELLKSGQVTDVDVVFGCDEPIPD